MEKKGSYEFVEATCDLVLFCLVAFFPCFVLFFFLHIILFLSYIVDQCLLFYLQFQEPMLIKTVTSSLHLTLSGRGVSPMVTLSVENKVFDMGAVLVKEYVEKSFKVCTSKMWSSYDRT
jgi:hypothetical protein